MSHHQWPDAADALLTEHASRQDDADFDELYSDEAMAAYDALERGEYYSARPRPPARPCIVVPDDEDLPF